MASDSDGNGRVPFTVSLKPDVLEEFKALCEKHGFLPSRRLEILMRKDVEADNDGSNSR